MAYTRTRAQLVSSLLVRGQYENSTDITPAVAGELINDAIEESYNEIVKRWDDYYIKLGATFTTVSGTDTYALASDFYKFRKLEILMSGVATDPAARWQRLYPVSVDDTHRHRIVGHKRYRYRLANGAVILVPVPATTVETLRIFYIPLAPQLISDSDPITFDTPIEQKLVLMNALRDCLDREDRDTSQIERKIGALYEQLRSSSDHDAGEPFYLGDRTGGDEECDW
jgi:hypothetical protein